MSDSDIKPGDVVRLRSVDRLLMTVESVRAHKASCVYMDAKGLIKRTQIGVAALEARRAPKPARSSEELMAEIG